MPVLLLALDIVHSLTMLHAPTHATWYVLWQQYNTLGAKMMTTNVALVSNDRDEITALVVVAFEHCESDHA